MVAPLNTNSLCLRSATEIEFKVGITEVVAINAANLSSKVDVAVGTMADRSCYSFRGISVWQRLSISPSGIGLDQEVRLNMTLMLALCLPASVLGCQQRSTSSG
jgi:hypothetical protein